LDATAKKHCVTINNSPYNIAQQYSPKRSKVAQSSSPVVNNEEGSFFVGEGMDHEKQV
jgi:hypothetical protein